MELARTGVIINTEKYGECVAFYRDLFALDVLFEIDAGEDSLTCFAFGGSYLMVETSGKAMPAGKSIAQCPMKLRINVEDIHEALRHVRSYGIDANIETFSWGAVINLYDPDGNRIGIRDEPGFSRQLGN